MSRRLTCLSEATGDLVGGVERFLHAIDSGGPLHPSDYSDLPIIRERLSNLEKGLFDEDPIAGARVLLHARTSTNTAAELYEGTVLHNGNGDAFRHLYWSYRIGSDPGVGSRWAERWGNAHEDGNPGQPSVERLMDLHNNLRGRQLAAAQADDDPRALRSAVRNGSCRICPSGTLVRSDSTGEL